MDPRRIVRVATLLVLTGAMLGLGPSAHGTNGLERAIAAQERNTARLMDRDGVVGTAASLTSRGQPVVVVLADGAVDVPRRVDGVRVAVRQTGPITATHHRAGHSGGPPGGGNGGGDDGNGGSGGGDSGTVNIGTSTGNINECAAGTIGARVKSGSTVYALSNNHVYARENKATAGANGEKVVAPGLFDAGCSVSNVTQLGTLSAFVALKFDGSNNKVDAAIAQTTASLLGTSTPSDGYGTPSSSPQTASLNLSVQKYGRTTQLTTGVVTAVNAIVNVGYGSGTARFVDQIIVESNKPFLKSGDSGSLLVTRSGDRPVGLLFASNVSGKLAVANQIGDVLGAFNVTVDAG